MDPVIAIVSFLKANATVAATVGTDSQGNQAVYDFDLPEYLSLVSGMAIPAVVVRPHGGPATYKQLYLNDTRIDVLTYGPTKHLSYVLWSQTYAALKGLTPSVWASTYIHHCNPAAGPIPQQDPQIQWPYHVASWLVRASDQTIP